jgi:phospholipid/cholesterol/gamma-HCH transport system substrate-binding protein
MGGKPIQRREITVVALFTLACVGAILFVWLRFGGALPLQASGYRVHVQFSQAANLATNEDVRIAGVTIGKTVSVTPTDGLTGAILEIDAKYAPLPDDVTAILRSKTLIGENFVELTPGSASAPKIPDGGTISTRQVLPTQQIDQVLAAFDAPTRKAFQTFLADTAAALKGQGPNLNSALAEASPATQELQQVISILDNQSGDVQKLVRDSGVALQAIGTRSSALQTLVTAGDSLLSATNASNRNLEATVNAFPPFLTALRPTLTDLQNTAQIAAPTLRALVPVAPLLTPALQETNSLAPQGTSLLRALPTLISDAQTGLPSATDIVHAVVPLAAALDPAGRQLVPVVQYAGIVDHDLLAAVANTSSAFEASTTLPNGQTQHYARVLAEINNEGAVGATAAYPTTRSNPYPTPASITGGSFPPAAFSCTNTSNPTTVPVIPGASNPGAPPCITQAPWTFDGVTQSFPQLQPFVPSP